MRGAIRAGRLACSRQDPAGLALDAQRSRNPLGNDRARWRLGFLSGAAADALTGGSAASRPGKDHPMTQEPRRTLKAWREARKLTHDGVWRAGSGVSAQDLARWEQTGAPHTRGRALQLADALQTPI